VPDCRAAELPDLVIDQPEGGKLPFELCSELMQHAPQSVLDGFGFGEGAADGVLNEKTTVEVVAVDE
jgi:hypothetical protein